MTTVTSGDGESLWLNIFIRLYLINKRRHRVVLYDCLIKTKHSAKKKHLSIECDVCPMSTN